MYRMQYVKDGWYTSRTKIIDNAVVGWGCWLLGTTSRFLYLALIHGR